LALAICGHAALCAQDYQPNAAAGDVPNPWNPNVNAYQFMDILRLIIFYNDDFGINAGDLVDAMRQKVRNWLVEDFEGRQTRCTRIYSTFHLRPKYTPRNGAFEGRRGGIKGEAGEE
jgi:hypothetical protein